MSKLAKLSLANRSLVALLSIAIVVFGFVATGSLKQELIPSLQLPGASIVTTYPGASPQIVERDVTERVESAIAGTDGLEGYTSTSSNGMSVVQAEFAYGTDIDNAVQDMQQSLNRTAPDLPDDTDPVVSAGSIDDFPVVALAVSSDLPEQELVDRLDTEVVPELSKIDGVRDAEVTGARTEQVTVRLDAEKLTQNGLTADSVNTALQANGISVPGGELTEGDDTVPVEVGAAFDSVAELEDLPILPSSTAPPATAPSTGAGTEAGQLPPTTPTTPQPGQSTQVPDQTDQTTQPAEPVRLGDVAAVDETFAPTTSITRTDGKASLGLSITKTSDANTVTISHEVQDQLSDLEHEIGSGTKFTVVFDQAPFIEDSIEGLTTEGLIGLAMAVLVILIFLLSMSSTLVTALSIPFSLLVAMIGLFAGGYSLNILTLGALTVAIGRVVDDSIVVLENIKRHLSYGEEKLPAILMAVREVAGAITASTITTVAVFLPIAFVGGQTGELFRPFAVTVTIALLASLLVALTIIPVLAYWFLRRPKGADADAQRVHDEAVAKERRSILQRMYVPVIRFTTKHRATTILAGIAVFIGTMAMTPLLQTNFLDQSGQNTLSITQTMPNGTSLERTDEAAESVEDVLEDTDGVETYQVTVGSEQFAGFMLGSGSNEATYSITTDDSLDTDQQKALEKRLRNDLDDLTNAGEISVGQQSGPEGSNLEVEVNASSDSALERAANQVERAMQRVDGTTDVTNNLASDTPTIDVDVDREEAAALGLSEAQIGDAVRQQFQGTTAGQVTVDGTTQDIVLRNGSAPGSLESLRALEIATPTGQTVRLDQVADLSRVNTAASLSRIDGERTATITATPENGDLGAVNTRLQTELDKLDLPAGASWELGGVSTEQQESFAQMGLALLAAIIIVFAVMVATFRSIAQALVLLISVPFAATGAIGLLILTDTPLGLPGLIGMLMLVGIVVTNAIVLIDLINQYRAAGMPLRQAVVDGGRRRLRPILMTALATICALIPMSLGLTGGGVLISQPLAIVVIGGLISSTLLTLVLVPTLYTMIEGVKERARNRRSARHSKPTRSADLPVDSPAGTADMADVVPAGVAAADVVPAGKSEGNGVHAPDPVIAHVASTNGTTDVNGDAKVTIEVRLRRD